MPEQYERKPNIKCFVCGEDIYRRPKEIEKTEGRAFCNRACYGIFCRKEKPCTVCGKPILANLHKKTCSRACANVQRVGIKYRVGSPNDKVKSQQALKVRLLRERGERCQRCGYSKPEILQVHHRDRNRNHNVLANLELICPNCHCEEHYLEKSWLKDRVKK